MNEKNAFDKSISELQLRALYELLPDVILKGFYAARFSKMLQYYRETLHPKGVADIRSTYQAGLSVEVNLGDRLGCDIYYDYFQERLEHALFMALVSPSDIVVDIGANYGMYALSAGKRLGEHGRVLAFEPDIRSVRLLERNIQQNKLTSKIACVQVCLGGEDAETEFYATSESSFSGLYNNSRSDVLETLRIPIRTLDSQLREAGIDCIDLIKIDVEGAEPEVLRGAVDVLARCDVMLMLEVSIKNQDDARRMELATQLQWLEQKGYVAFYIQRSAVGRPPRLRKVSNLALIADFEGEILTLNYFFAKSNGRYFKKIPAAFNTLDLENSRPIASAVNELNVLEAQLWATRLETEVASEAYRKLSVQVAEIKAVDADLASRLDHEALELGGLQFQYHNILEENTELKITNLGLKDKLAQCGFELDKMKATKQDFKKKLESFGEKLTKMNASKQEYKCLLSLRDNEIAKCRDEKAKLESMVLQFKEDMVSEQMHLSNVQQGSARSTEG